MPGGLLLRLLADGKVYPYNLGVADAQLRALRIPVDNRAPRRVRDRDIRAVQLVALVERACNATGLAATLETWSVLLGCCPKTAGDCVRELAACGVLELLPEYVEVLDGDGKVIAHTRVCSTYRLGKVVRDALDVAQASRRAGGPRPSGENYQASEKDPPTSGSGAALAGRFGVGSADIIASGGPGGRLPPPAPGSEAFMPGATGEAEAPEGVASEVPRQRPATRNPAAVVASLTKRWEQLRDRDRAALAKQVEQRLAPVVGAHRARDAAAAAVPGGVAGPFAELAAALGGPRGPAPGPEVAAAVALARQHAPSCVCVVCDVLRRWGAT